MVSTPRGQGFVADRLRDEHKSFGRVFEDLVRRAREGDWHDVDEVWDAFVAQVESHFAYEEREVFPAYAATGAEGARLVDELGQEHQRVRRMLDELGVQIQLHCVRATAIERLVEVLEQHAATEDRSVYPWLVGAIQPVAQPPAARG